LVIVVLQPFRLRWSAPKVDSSLSWIKGWWKVSDGSTYYYYFFRPDGVVQYTRTKPVNLNAAPVHPKGIGRYSYSAP
jgi:hypothetical protein